MNKMINEMIKAQHAAKHAAINKIFIDGGTK